MAARTPSRRVTRSTRSWVRGVVAANGALPASGVPPPQTVTSDLHHYDHTMTAVPPILPPGVITQEFHTPRAVRRGVIAGV